MCEFYSFAQRKVFALKRKRLWLLLAIVLGPKLWAHLCQWLGEVCLGIYSVKKHPDLLPGSLLLVSNKQLI